MARLIPVYNDATQQAELVDVESLRGAAGAPGITGPQGPVGPQGLTGPQGPAGHCACDPPPPHTDIPPPHTDIPPPGAKTLLTPKDFTFRRSFLIQTNGQDQGYAQGLTHRYVDGDLRLLIGQLGGVVHEVSLVDAPDVIRDVTGAWALPQVSAFNGLWWEEEFSRLWVAMGVDYESNPWPAHLYTVALGKTATGRKDLHFEGGIPTKRVYGGVQRVPPEFRAALGEYVAGWGGYTSLMGQGGGASLGLTMYGFPNPDVVPHGGSVEPRVLADHVSGSGTEDWYASGAPTTHDRGARLPTVENYYDGNDPRENPPTRPTVPPLSPGNWASPSPDGRGRFVWGDSYYNTGNWIETPTKRGFITVACVATGKAWYQSSTLAHDRRGAELHIFDPRHFVDVVEGRLLPHNVQPTYLHALPFPTPDETWIPGGNIPSGNAAGATYVPEVGRLYIAHFGAETYFTRVYEYEVAA